MMNLIKPSFCSVSNISLPLVRAQAGKSDSLVHFNHGLGTRQSLQIHCLIYFDFAAHVSSFILNEKLNFALLGLF
jgi:hypothetical protein